METNPSFFINDGETSQHPNRGLVLITAGNSLPQDDDLRVLVMQVTPPDLYLLSYQVAPFGDYSQTDDEYPF